MRTHSGARFNLILFGVNILAFIRSSTLCLLTFLRCFVTSADFLYHLRNSQTSGSEFLLTLTNVSFLPALPAKKQNGDYTWVDL